MAEMVVPSVKIHPVPLIRLSPTANEDVDATLSTWDPLAIEEVRVVRSRVIEEIVVPDDSPVPLIDSPTTKTPAFALWSVLEAEAADSSREDLSMAVMAVLGAIPVPERVSPMANVPADPTARSVDPEATAPRRVEVSWEIPTIALRAIMPEDSITSPTRRFVFVVTRIEVAPAETAGPSVVRLPLSFVWVKVSPPSLP
jgi:hypothetical protein